MCVHHEIRTLKRMIAIANSIQFWRGIPPKITPCLTNQSTGAPPQEKNIEKLFHPPLAGYYEKSGNFSRTCRISMTEDNFDLGLEPNP